MTDCVDASVEAVQKAVLDTPCNLAGAQSRGQQLGVGDDASLAARQIIQRRDNVTRLYPSGGAAT